MKPRMKTVFFVTMLILPLATTLKSCSNDDDTPTNPIDLLPPATQTGTGTFACLVNGKAFTNNDNSMNCYYQYVDEGYYFYIGGEDDKNIPQNIYLFTKEKEIFEGETYILLSKENGNAYGGGGFIYSPAESYASYTNPQYTGELTITKLDFENHIVSGIFWFNLKHPLTGDTIKIHEGRFDSHFYQ